MPLCLHDNVRLVSLHDSVLTPFTESWMEMDSAKHIWVTIVFVMNIRYSICSTLCITWWKYVWLYLLNRCRLMWISSIRSDDRLMFVMGISIPIRLCILSEQRPLVLSKHMATTVVDVQQDGISRSAGKKWKMCSTSSASFLGKLLDIIHGPLTKYVKLRVAHEPGMPGTFSPPLTSTQTAS